METPQQRRYSDHEIELMDAEQTAWRTLLASDGWYRLSKVLEGAIHGWGMALAVISKEEVEKIQGMIAGARVALSIPGTKVEELQAQLEEAREESRQ